jgi:mRNA-degrading endonuclease RelE of RelBE toxin-antitoxin system
MSIFENQTQTGKPEAVDFRIADTFTDALARLPAQDQKAVKVSVLDLQLDPAAPGLQMHRLDRSKDANFWSARVNDDLRLILHRRASSILVAYVGRHDDAYAWAQRRRIEVHPNSGVTRLIAIRNEVPTRDYRKEAPLKFMRASAIATDTDELATVPDDSGEPTVKSGLAGWFGRLVKSLVSRRR